MAWGFLSQHRLNMTSTAIWARLEQHHTQTGNSIYTDLALAEYDSLGIESDFLALPTYHQEPG